MDIDHKLEDSLFAASENGIAETYRLIRRDNQGSVRFMMEENSYGDQSDFSRIDEDDLSDIGKSKVNAVEKVN